MHPRTDCHMDGFGNTKCGYHQKHFSGPLMILHMEGTVKIDILKSRKGIGEPPNGPSGPRRECAAQAFSPQVKTLAQGRLCRPEH